jgi:hypothetical protein
VLPLAASINWKCFAVSQPTISTSVCPNLQLNLPTTTLQEEIKLAKQELLAVKHGYSKRNKIIYNQSHKNAQLCNTAISRQRQLPSQSPEPGI